MKKQIINCTPHDVNIIDDNGNIIACFKPEPIPARCKKVNIEVDLEGIDNIVDGRTIRRRTIDVVENLPAPKENVFYIVSRWTAEAAIDRFDLLTPYGVIRDNEGNKIGCRKLGFVW